MYKVINYPGGVGVQRNNCIEEYCSFEGLRVSEDWQERNFIFNAWVDYRKEKFNLVLDETKARFSVEEVLKGVAQQQKKFDEITIDFLMFAGMMRQIYTVQKNDKGFDVFVAESGQIFCGNYATKEEAYASLRHD